MLILNLKGLNAIKKIKQKRNNYYDNKLMVTQDINEIKKLVKLRNENTLKLKDIINRIENYAG